MRAKAEYSRQHGLGGIMFWELSGDTPDGELISAIADGLK
jgi:chitinase